MKKEIATIIIIAVIGLTGWLSSTIYENLMKAIDRNYEQTTNNFKEISGLSARIASMEK